MASAADGPLLQAPREEDLDGAKQALDNGANIDAVTDDFANETALIVAARSGFKVVVEYLIRKGANIEAQTYDGYTALMVAAANGHDQVVNVILGNGANVNTQTNCGHTALMLAALQGFSGVVEVLLNHGADISMNNNNGKTALDLANKQSYPGPGADYPAIITMLSNPPPGIAEIISALRDKVDSLSQENNTLRSEADSREEEIIALRSEIDSLNQENVALTSEVDSLKCENNCLSGKQMDLEKLFHVPAQNKQIVLDETEEQRMRIKEEDIQGQTIDDFGLSDDQLDELIVESDMFYLAHCFGAWPLYTGNPGLQLTPGDQHTIIANPNLVNNQMKMKKGLMMWQSSNPILATFRRLLQILLILEEGDVAMKISQYIKSSLRTENNTLATGATPCEVDDLTTEGGSTTSKYCVVASDEDTQSVHNCNLTTEVGALKSEVGILLAALDTLKLQVTTLTSENDTVESKQKNRNTTVEELEDDTAEEQPNDLELQELSPLIPLTFNEDSSIQTSSNLAHGCCVMI